MNKLLKYLSVLIVVFASVVGLAVSAKHFYDVIIDNTIVVTTGNGLTVGSETPTATEWGYITAMDQQLATTDFPTFNGVDLDDPINFSQESTPANPAASNNKFYFKSDDLPYILDSGGTETAVVVGAVSASDKTYNLENMGLDSTVSASALTIHLKQSDGGSDATAGSAIRISFRDLTITDGGYVSRAVTGALSVVVPSGATLGHPSGADGYIYVYAVDNAGTISLAVSSVAKDEESVQTISAIGVGSDDSGFYGTSLTDKAVRFLGRLKSNQVSAGTWDLVPTEASLNVGGVVVPDDSTSSSAQPDTAWPFTAGQYGDHTSISLTPGVWILTGIVTVRTTGTPGAISAMELGISTTSGNSGAGLTAALNLSQSYLPNNSGVRYTDSVVNYRVSVTTTTTYYLKGYLSVTTSINQQAYSLIATRVK